VSRGEGRKRERDEEERERKGSHILPTSLRLTSDGTGLSVAPQQSSRLSCAKRTGATKAGVVPHRHQAMRLPHKLRHVHWRDSFISHINQTGVTQMSQILEISFGPVHFSNFFKRLK
jgi:hypothetical protein